MNSDQKSGRNSLTYKDAGVDIDAGDALVDRIAPLAKATRRPGADADLGGFGGIVRPQGCGLQGPDTRRLHGRCRHQAQNRHRYGAMRRNRTGPRRDVRQRYRRAGRRAAVLSRLFRDRQARRRAGCDRDRGNCESLQGLQLRADRWRDGGNAGALCQRRFRSRGIHRRRRRARTDSAEDRYDEEGDVVIGVASSGVHSNGYSLVRRVVADAGLSYDAPAPFAARAFSRRSAAGTDQALCHERRSPRFARAASKVWHTLPAAASPKIFRAHCRTASMRRSIWARGRRRRFSAGFAKSAGIGEREMLRTFNCGIGMIAVVSPDKVDESIAAFAGEAPYRESGRSFRATANPRFAIAAR